MSTTPDLSSFGKFVPGFDFLQNLAKQAAGGAAQSIPQLPNLGNWVAPTLNVEELDKRIEELKTVRFFRAFCLMPWTSPMPSSSKRLTR